MNRKLLTSGLLAGLVAGAGAGLVLEQTGLVGAASSDVAVVSAEDPSTTDATVDTDADADADTDAGTDTRPDRSARLTEILQPLVDDGTITADQLAAVIDALDAAGPMGGRGGPGDMHGRGPGLGLDTAAEALGMSVDELRTALGSGQTIAEIAAASGVDAQTVIDELVTAAGQHLADEVTEGDLTQEEADARLAELTTRITDMVNNGLPAGPMGQMGDGDGMGGHGRGHGPDADSSDSSDTSDAAA